MLPPQTHAEDSVGFTSRRNPSPSADMGDQDLQSKILDRLQQMDFAFHEANRRTHELASAVLEKQSSAEAEASIHEAYQKRLSDLEARLEEISSEKTDQQGQRSDFIDDMQARSQALEAALSEVRASMAMLGEQMHQILELQKEAQSSTETGEASPTTDRLNQILQETQSLKGSVNDIAPSISSYEKYLSDQFERLKHEVIEQAEACTNALKGRSDQLETQITASLNDVTAALSRALSEQEPKNLNQSLEDTDSITRSVTAVLQSKLAAALNEIPAQIRENLKEEFSAIGDLSNQMVEIRDKVQTLGTRPDPTLDLGPQKRSFAQFSLVLKSIVERFQNLDERISGNLNTLESKQSAGELSDAKLDAIAKDLQSLRTDDGQEAQEDSTNTSLILDAIAALSTQLSELPKHQDSVIVQTPAQQKSFARFHTANRASIERLEVLVDAFSERFGALETYFEDLPSKGDGELVAASSGMGASVLAPLGDLAEANKILASKQQPFGGLEDEHYRFLRDLRIAVAETLALSLQISK